MSRPSPPVFHPDHPHNRAPHAFINSTVSSSLTSTSASAPTYGLNNITTHSSNPTSSTPLGPGFTRANIPQSSFEPPLAILGNSKSSSTIGFFPLTPKQQMRPGPGGTESAMSDSDLSSPDTPRRCYCGQAVDINSGMYCSVACARSDAFHSLCYKPGQSTSSTTFSNSNTRNQPSLVSIIASTLSRDASSSSADVDVGLDLDRSTTSASARSTRGRNIIDIGADGSAESSPFDQDLSGHWNASHYRRLARADMRREERKEERRRRRRADGSGTSISSSSRGPIMSTTSSIASSRVPDLVGGSGADGYNYHSRNPSVASSVTSMASSNWSSLGGLSRNPSTASSSSRRGVGTDMNKPGVNFNAVIMEDADESEYLHDETEPDNMDRPYFPSSLRSGGARHYPYPATVARRAKAEEVAAAKRKKMTADFGMGRDMRDVLEEIISMEKEFLISDEDENQGFLHEPSQQTQMETSSNVNSNLLSTPSRHRMVQRPPRTPSPIADKENSVIPQAPIGPGRRPSLGSGMVPSSSRPASLLGFHQSSLSESHTALYLATASPVRSVSASGKPSSSSNDLNNSSFSSSSRPRRSASPTLQARESISFTPQAGPALPILRARMDSPVGLSSTTSISTPVRRRNITPNAHHPTMDHWRFPTSSSSASLPSVAAPASANECTSLLVADMQSTPTPAASSNLSKAAGIEDDRDSVLSMFHTSSNSGSRQRSCSGKGNGNELNRTESTSSTIFTAPHLLWPPPPNLAPSLFPSTPGIDGTPEFVPFSRSRPDFVAADSALLVAASGDANNMIITDADNSTGENHATIHADDPARLGVVSMRSRTSADRQPNSSSPPNLKTRGAMAPPNSGLKLGVLLGSGDVEMEMEVDEDEDDEEGNGDNVMSSGSAFKKGQATYLPVFLEAEGFSARRWA